jgi:hypothetical protein
MTDNRSPAAESWRHWYWTERWRKISRHQITSHPLCTTCEERGSITPATICDHITPHKGNPDQFWNGPFQSLCKTCHDSVKAREEARGYRPGVDQAGRPVDPRHPWNRATKS